MKMNDKNHNSLKELIWEIKVPILKNNLILKQLGLAIGIPFGALVIFFIIIKAYNGLILISATFALALLLIAIVFRGTYDVRYVLNDKEIACFNQKSQKKRVKVLSTITLLLGLFKSNPTVAGAGILSYKSTEVLIPLKRIRRIKYYESKKLIKIYGGFAENIVLFCTNENYPDVRQFIRNIRGDA